VAGVVATVVGQNGLKVKGYLTFIVNIFKCPLGVVYYRCITKMAIMIKILKAD
jgi:hypothetical protein